MLNGPAYRGCRSQRILARHAVVASQRKCPVLRPALQLERGEILAGSQGIVVGSVPGQSVGIQVGISSHRERVSLVVAGRLSAAQGRLVPWASWRLLECNRVCADAHDFGYLWLV